MEFQPFISSSLYIVCVGGTLPIVPIYYENSIFLSLSRSLDALLYILQWWVFLVKHLELLLVPIILLAFASELMFLCKVVLRSIHGFMLLRWYVYSLSGWKSMWCIGLMDNTDFLLSTFCPLNWKLHVKGNKSNCVILLCYSNVCIIHKRKILSSGKLSEMPNIMMYKVTNRTGSKPQ